MSGWSILAASALGSLHCVGMCGGLVSFYAARDTPAASRVAPHVAYHALRLVAYTALGATAGQLGSALDRAGARLGLGALGLGVVALALLGWGVPVLLGRRAARPLLVLGRQPARRGWLIRQLERGFVALATRLRQLPPLWRAGALGLGSALLPCGWLYAFVMLAAGSGSALSGATLMLAFWAGTVPALLGLGLSVERLSAPLRARLPRLSAAVVLALCALTVLQRWPLARASDATPAATPSCHGSH